MNESEKLIERYLVKRIHSINGLCHKYITQGVRGAPDRICLLPNGRVIFVEVKSSNGVLSSAQQREHAILRSLGFEVHVLYSHDEVDILISKIQLKGDFLNE
jgi:hypothetical protein